MTSTEMTLLREIKEDLAEMKESAKEDRKQIRENAGRINYIRGMVAAMVLGLPFLLFALQKLS